LEFLGPLRSLPRSPGGEDKDFVAIVDLLHETAWLNVVEKKASANRDEFQRRQDHIDGQGYAECSCEDAGESAYFNSNAIELPTEE
jgi:hypothetical protein